MHLEPNNPQAHNNLGNARLQQDRVGEAIASYRQAITLLPAFPEAHANLAAALWRIGNMLPALQHCRTALELAPQSVNANWQLASILLLLGQFREGWALYEWRTQIEAHLQRNFRQPQWKGEQVSGQTLLLHAEQGLGDTIQFLRYVPLVRQYSKADRILLECPPSLQRLLSEGNKWSVDLIYPLCAEETSPPPFDVHLPLPSPPLVLGTFEPLQTPKPYLHASPDLREAWKRRLGSRKYPRVGLIWAGNPQHDLDHRRSIEFEALAPILNVASVCFYTLQIGTRRAQPEQLAAHGVTDLTVYLTDFADTAAFMAELDLIISVDTATAHLAGALGRPVWTLLPFVPDWRWGLEREDTPWYPTMRLFRQSAAGDWDSVL